MRVLRYPWQEIVVLAVLAVMFAIVLTFGAKWGRAVDEAAAQYVGSEN